MSLQIYLREGKIEKIDSSIDGAKIKKEKAFKTYRFSWKNLKEIGYESNIYTNVYDSIRIGCEAILLLYGYKVKKGEGHHLVIIDTAKDLINGGLKNEFSRIQRMRKRRHNIEYDILEISRAELIQAVKDAKKLLKRVDKLIQEKDLQKRLI